MNKYEEKVKANLDVRRENLIIELENYFHLMDLKMDKYEPYMMGYELEQEFNETKNAQLSEFAENLIEDIEYFERALTDVKDELSFFNRWLAKDDAIFRYKTTHSPAIDTWADSGGCYATMETDEYIYIVSSECSECLSMYSNNIDEPYMPEDEIFSLPKEELSDKGKEIYNTLHDRLLKEFGNSYRNL